MAAGPLDAGHALWQAAAEAPRIPAPSVPTRWGTAWRRAGRDGRTALVLYVVGTLAGVLGGLAVGHGPAWASALSVVAIAIGARTGATLCLWLLSPTARDRITPRATIVDLAGE